MSVEEEIGNLNEKDKKIFLNNLTESLYDRRWCLINNINYVNPDFSKAKEILYKEMFNK
jgi:hypothetical protein